jgi:hypothetical protein
MSSVPGCTVARKTQHQLLKGLEVSDRERTEPLRLNQCRLERKRDKECGKNDAIKHHAAANLALILHERFCCNRLPVRVDPRRLGEFAAPTFIVIRHS